MNKVRWAFSFWIGLFVIVLASRLCHCGILWADEDYHLAATIQTFFGKMPYRDFWYDKPVLNIAFYALFGARTDWILRLAGALYVCGSCALAFRFASRLWTRREGYLAASLLGFFLIFYFHGANIPLQPDTLMIAPHLAAVYFAWQRRHFFAGMAAGVAFLLNTKGLFVLASCAAFGLGGWHLLLLGFIAPGALALGWLHWNSAALDYWQQVWKWGFHYARSASVESPVQGIDRVLNWLGFHFVLAMASVLAWWKERDLSARLAAWAVISLAAAGIGWRFAPHYFNQLLPPLVIAASRGISRIIEIRPVRPNVLLVRSVLILALIIPVVRFSPRYALLAKDLIAGNPHNWKDLALDQASKKTARILQGMAKENDTIFIWGYWPKIIAYTRLPVASRFWDSQPLTAIPADHLLKNVAHLPEDDWILKNRRELTRARPAIIVDGLSALNPSLDIRRYPELQTWFSDYRLEASTPFTRIYRRVKPE